MDRFSDLPDDVAHRVILFLSMEDISRLSVASKRCRQLCKSTPFLNFDILPYTHNATKRARLMNYIKSFLSQRKPMINAQSCCIRWYHQINKEYRILSRLLKAVMANVKNLELHVSIASGSRLTLPSSLLGCTSLESLDMSFHDNGIAILNTPSSFATLRSPSSLKELQLESVFIDDSFGNWISSHCKLLKKLALNDVKGTTRIVITSSSLDMLVISSHDECLSRIHVSAEILRHLLIVWRFNSPDNRVLQLSTPNLKILHWLGNIVNLSVAENFKDLKFSNILLEFSGITSANRSLLHAIRALCNCDGLALYDHSLQGCSPTWFADLLALGICVTGSSANPERFLTTFLKGTPNLYGLSIARNKYKPLDHIRKEMVGCRDMCGSELDDTPFLKHLMFVRIEVVSQQNDELELIEFVLKNAQNLKKMAIVFSDHLRSDFSREISGFEKASSDAVVSFRMI